MRKGFQRVARRSPRSIVEALTPYHAPARRGGSQNKSPSVIAISKTVLPGTASSADVEAIKALAVSVGAPGDFTIHLRRLNRGFLLDDAFLPQASFVQWSGDAVLTPGRPEALIWWAA